VNDHPVVAKAEGVELPVVNVDIELQAAEPGNGLCAFHKSKRVSGDLKEGCMYSCDKQHSNPLCYLLEGADEKKEEVKQAEEKKDEAPPAYEAKGE
jgi:hypothetical protein